MESEPNKLGQTLSSHGGFQRHFFHLGNFKIRDDNMQYESYLESMQGVILEHNYDRSSYFQPKDYILKILVNHPFNAEISIIMNTDTWNKYVNYSASNSWRGALETHPEGYSSIHDFYYNLQEDRFYRGFIDHTGDLVWRESTIGQIIDVSRLAWIFSRHIEIEDNRFHAGQTCEFTAYAIDKNKRLYKPSTIDKDFFKYTWIYDPLTFKAQEITSESVEHLITKMQIPHPVADKIIQKCKSEKKRSRDEAIQQWILKVTTPLSNLWKRIRKEESSINIVWKGVAIISSIWAIWASFFKGK